MPDSSGATVFDDLPEWLVVDEILLRLPPKDVLRCRAVRRSWRSGTSTDKFILDHHRRQPSLPIIEHQKGICRLPVPSGAGDKKIRPFVRYTPVTRIDVMHHGACDGLLILSLQHHFYICNPATHRCASLPRPPLRPGIGSVSVVAFYRHPTSGEHRVLWAVYSIGLMSLAVVEPPDYFVLAVGSDQPRLIQWPIVSEQGYPAAESSICPPVHHRGSLHWAMGRSITVFDTVAETFHQMSRPAQLGDMVSLLDMGGALALSSTTREFVTLDVWVLQDYDAQTWGFQYRINLRAMVAAPPLNLRADFVPRMVAIDERELLIQKGWRLFCCDIDGKFLGNVEIEEHENYLTLTKHRLQESMISLPLFERQEQAAVNNVPPFLIVL
ncbi:F-box/LRR-repeat protein At2g43260-like [Lolium rigidum]|uniref:F-box/LRR-repeat protein At2g43260-like n=1 Tax=Lolium rigidum TaxID=89674 RepID=UPI001F5D3BB8|nr:F-box/LRR-repeat protein At2g43260-like [Lolium rigidum]